MSKNKKRTEIEEQEALTNQFIMEVDEDLKQDDISKVWKKLSGVIVVVCIIIVAIVGYFQYEKSQNQKLADRDSHLYQQAITLQQDSKSADAVKKLDEIIKNNGKYKIIASMQKAHILTKTSINEAFKTYMSVFKDSATSDIYKNVALTHAGYIAVTQANLFSTVKDDITKLSKTTNKFKYLALEILAWESIHTKNYSDAKRHLNVLLADTNVPRGMKARSKIILESLNSDLAPKNKSTSK